MTHRPEHAGSKGFPPWLRTRVNVGRHRREVSDLVKQRGLHTVCQSARCPNLAQCWHSRTATFMILGGQCTRNCTFCAVDAGTPLPPDPAEPEQVARAAAELNLQFAVVTSVTRDDLPDRGAGQFVQTIHALRRALPECRIEVLIPDFGGDMALLGLVMDAGPAVLNHNIETCRRLTPTVRSGADYERSLQLLRRAAEMGQGQIATKSGLMLGLGESDEEVVQTMRDLREQQVDILTIGQYLPPSPQHRELDRYVTPEQFDGFAALAGEMGFKGVSSTPMTRSSYRAEELAAAVLGFEPASSASGDGCCH